jgi:hypothetical protein
MAPSEKRQHGKRNRDERDHVPSYHASAALAAAPRAHR